MGVRVQVTVFDLIALMDMMARKVGEIFDDAVETGVTETDFGWPYRAFHMVVKKPCPFLVGDLCAVHHAKPLACRLFPEAFIVREKIEELRRHPEFRFFPCVITPPVLSDDGRDAVMEFDAMWQRERAVSNHFVFGAPAVLVDARRLPKKEEESRNLFSSPALLMKVKERVAPLECGEVRERLLARLLDRSFVARLLRESETPGMIFEVSTEGFFPKPHRPSPALHARYI